MKNSFSFIGAYIFTLLLITVLVSAILLLYPAIPGTAVYVGALERIADIFVYSFFSLLPLTSIISLLAIVFTVIKRGRSSVLDFLIFIFLCCVVWLLIIPFCYLYRPAPRISFLITGEHASPAATFFKTGFSYIPLRDNEALYFSPPSLITGAVSKLLFAGTTLRAAVDGGKFSYLISASVGLALAALYGFYAFSCWKLLNAVLVTILWTAVSVLNVYIYTPYFVVVSPSKWLPLIINGSLCVLFLLPPLIRLLVRAKRGIKE